jgi:glycine betaine/proline transport system substrate-binding protein
VERPSLEYQIEDERHDAPSHKEATSMRLRKTLAFSAIVLAVGAGLAQAGEPESCRKIRMADVGWTDNTAQNGLFNVVVKPLGYQTKIDVLALPIILEGLKNKNLDLFLDNWLPSNAEGTKSYVEHKWVEQLPPDLEGAPYGPVVPNYVADAGIKDLKDLAPNSDKFEKKFYGIEPGNDGNKIVQKLIDDPSTGLKGWKLIESSEQGMLAEAQKDMAKKKWVVFLGWAPHPVMAKMPITYLTGFDKSGFGASHIHAMTRVGLSTDCPNLGKLLANLKFTIPMESEVMGGIDKGKTGDASATDWLKANPGVLDSWLAGVTTADGQDGAAAVKKSLGL